MADWKITWGDLSFTDEDLTVGDLALASMLSGEGWNACDPTAGPNACANLIAAFIARRNDRPIEQVSAEIANAPAIRLLAAIGRPDAPQPPPDRPSAGVPSRSPKKPKAPSGQALASV